MTLKLSLKGSVSVNENTYSVSGCVSMMLKLARFRMKAKHIYTLSGYATDSKGMCVIICKTFIIPHRYCNEFDMSMLARMFVVRTTVNAVPTVGNWSLN